jgi:hypothetical protein
VYGLVSLVDHHAEDLSSIVDEEAFESLNPWPPSAACDRDLEGRVCPRCSTVLWLPKLEFIRRRDTVGMNGAYLYP